MSIAQPTYQLSIGGVEYGQFLEHDTWTITQNFGRQGTTAHFQLFDDWSQRTPSVPQVIVKPLQEVMFTDTSTGAVLFAGYATAPNITTFSQTANEWLIDC